MAKKAYIGVPTYNLIVENTLTYSSDGQWSWGLNTSNEVNWTKGNTYVCNVEIDGVVYPNLTFAPDVGASWFATYSNNGEEVFGIYVSANNQLYDYKLGLDTTISHNIKLWTGNLDGTARKIKKGYIGIENFVKKPLPNGYTQIEYIQSSGTQYFNTGFKPNNNTRVVMDFENTGDYSGMTTSLCPFFGARNASSSAVFALWIGTKTFPQYGNVAYNKNGNFTVNLNTRLIYDFNKNVVTIGDTTITCATATFTTSYEMCLLTINNYGTIESRRASGKLYSCKIYDNGTLIRDYVPCKNSVGTVGLYDMVNGKFYANAGTGTFTAGATVTGSVARNIKKGYLGVNAIARQVFPAPSVGALPVGSSVWMNYRNEKIEFLVVNQGIPQNSSLYDKSCDGTWLLMKPADRYNGMYWNGSTTSSNSYEKSNMYRGSETVGIENFDADIQAIIKQVKIPYSTGRNGTIKTGANGHLTKTFLLSMYELGLTTSDSQYIPIDGAKLAYFDSGTGTAAKTKRIAYESGKSEIEYYAKYWWTRSPSHINDTWAFVICSDGSHTGEHVDTMYYRRPALILPFSTKIDEDFNVIP